MSKKITYTHRPFTQYALPPRVLFNNSEKDVFISFSLSPALILLNSTPDRADWLKLYGYSFHMFTNHKNSFMIAFRWNQDRELFDITAYFHRNGIVIKGFENKESLSNLDTIYNPAEVMGWVGYGKECVVRFVQDYDGGNFGIKLIEGFDEIRQPESVIKFDEYRKLKRIINPHHGGSIKPERYAKHRFKCWRSLN